MCKILSGLFLGVILASPAWAYTVTAPGPEVDGGILGMIFAAGAAYLVIKRRRS